MTVIGITGASGALGRLVARDVLAAHPASDTVLFSRTPASLAEFGTTVRAADFSAPDGLVDAFRGVDVLLLISTDAVGSRQAQHRAAIDAAAAAGVGRIAYTSTINADKEFPARLRPLTDDHAATEAMLRAAGPAWTVLRNSLYLEAISAGWEHAVAAGKLVSNNGSGKHAPVAREDCAAAAAAVLLGGGHDNTVYDITGERLLDDTAIAAVLSAHAGTPVEAVAIDDDAFEAGLVQNGLPAEFASVLTGFGEAIRGGLMAAPLGVTETLIGRAPTSIEQFL
jgi:NAD(P)H dehydrogenase (quinone)